MLKDLATPDIKARWNPTGLLDSRTVKKDSPTSGDVRSARSSNFDSLLSASPSETKDNAKGTDRVSVQKPDSSKVSSHLQNSSSRANRMSADKSLAEKNSLTEEKINSSAFKKMSGKLGKVRSELKATSGREIDESRFVSQGSRAESNLPKAVDSRDRESVSADSNTTPDDFFIETTSQKVESYSIKDDGTPSGPQVSSKKAGSFSTAQSVGDGKVKKIELDMAEVNEPEQKSMTDFLGQMQERFGINPEKVIQAFSKMNEEQLQQPAAVSSLTFVQNLGLSEKDQVEAKGLYEELLTKLDGVSADQLSVEVLDQRDFQVQDLNSGLDRMNKMFFDFLQDDKLAAKTAKATRPAGDGIQQFQKMAGQADLQSAPSNTKLGASDNATVAVEVEGAASFSAGQIDESDDSNSSSLTEAEADKLSPALQKNTKALTSKLFANAEKDSSGKSSDLNNQSLQQDPADDAATDLMSDEKFNEMVGKDIVSEHSRFEQEARGTKPLSSAANGQSASPANVSEFNMQTTKTETGRSQKEGRAGTSVERGAASGASRIDATTGNSVIGSDSAIGSTSPAVAKGEATAAGSMFAVKTGSDTKIENMKELVNRAQVIARQGGGEMKMDLKPEGLGSVTLKVAVNNGQVSIQMVTENSQTKKAIEEGLSELKSSLVAHKLQLDQLKVHSPEAGSQSKLDQQQADAQREQARQFASDFMGSFRDERQAFQQGFADNFGSRMYNREPKRVNVQPEVTQKSQAKTTSNRRLNLVA